MKELQKDIICGSLLGKGFINCQNRFVFKQKDSYVDYVQYLAEMLSPYSSPVRISPQTVNKYKSSYAIFYTTSDFQQWKSLWYYNKHKIIPRDLVLNKEIVTHWYYQSGQYIHSKNPFVIFKSSYSKDDCFYLIHRLKEDLNILSTLNKNKDKWNIRIGSNQVNKLIELIDPMFSCFSYKLIRTKGYKSSKLNMKIANKIRGLVDEKTQKELANTFGVSQACINKIINNKIYKIKEDFHAGGMAVVRTGYNFIAKK